MLKELRIVMCGWLLKRGHFVKNIKRRWFQAQLNPPQLLYYESDEAAVILIPLASNFSQVKGKKPLGIIELDSSTIKEDAESELAFWILTTKPKHKDFYLLDISVVCMKKFSIISFIFDRYNRKIR